MSRQDALIARCQSVAQLSRQALDWVGNPQNAETVGPAQKSLSQNLRRAARRAERLGKSAQTKMSVSVFGPSQAGKSFLVSVLARPENGRLTADFHGPGGQLDYIREINPEGEGESTGLVTRFTMTKDAMPDGFPIQLNLLTEADIARTICNSFYMDGDQSEPSPDSALLSQHLDTFRSKAGSTEVPGTSFEEVFEIRDYVQSAFGRTAYAAALKPFWDEAATIAPFLSVRDRAAFFEILWGWHTPLTELYIKLAAALAHIGHAEIVHTQLNALIPRETSIIDVKALHALFDENPTDMLSIRVASGQIIELPRASVCALAAELVFPMLELPSQVFAETDLLDFPGARNRFEQPLSKTLAEPEKTLSQLLLRGKIAYLFDRYVENQEITSMLLCVPDSNMETLDLPGLVDNWIAMTHGNQPEIRANVDCILFMVLTKFDKHLGESAAGGGEASRFERRMQASLLEKFGRSKDGWVDNWASNQPFQNCYWLRNPNFFVEGLIDYDDNQRELGIRPEKVSRVTELKSGCLAAASVQRHFKNPEKAWDAALALNDGGVSYLTEELTAVCVPDSKIRQLGTQIDKLSDDLVMALSPFYVSDDVAQRIEDKQTAAAEITDCLELTLQSHRFGSFLNTLSVDQETIEDQISRVPSSIRISSAISTTAVEPTVRSGLSRPGRPGRPGAARAPEPVTEEAAPDPGRVRTMSPEDFQSNAAVDIWVDGLNEFRNDIETLNAYNLTESAASDLVSELIHGIRRTSVLSEMKAQLKAIDYGLTVDKQAAPAAIVCSECINNFVFSLGATGMDEADRPVIELPDGSKRPAFVPKPTSNSSFDLPLLQRASAEETWTDWVYMLDTLFVGNAKDTASGEIDIEQNMAIGEVITDLSDKFLT